MLIGIIPIIVPDTLDVTDPIFVGVVKLPEASDNCSVITFEDDSVEDDKTV